MLPIKNLKSQRAFHYFEQISAIPRGSGNMRAIAKFCVDFAERNNLKYLVDDLNNVIIYKDGTDGYAESNPIILQGHLDMVCQKTADCDIDFENDGLDLYVDGDFIKARGTTLGADNGIAVAIILAILESRDIAHPPIEAVFTVDEEVGMIGASALDTSVLKSKRMINLDSEEDGTVTVSCAGGSDFITDIPLKTASTCGTLANIEINGLKGGHSGVEINKNRVNANMIAGRILNALENEVEIIAIDGGDKDNAIPNRCKITVCVANTDAFKCDLQNQIDIIKSEISDREPDFNVDLTVGNTDEYDCFDAAAKSKIIYTLLCVPNGVTEMSAEIEGLVQTSLNLGVLTTQNDRIHLHFALRSNKQSALYFLEERLTAFFNLLEVPNSVAGHYPPWEYNEISVLRDTYISVYENLFNEKPKVEAIHAGLECGVFASKIDGFDCIAIGPALYDVHTVNEKLSISSTENLYNLIIKILENLK